MVNFPSLKSAQFAESEIACWVDNSGIVQQTSLTQPFPVTVTNSSGSPDNVNIAQINGTTVTSGNSTITAGTQSVSLLPQNSTITEACPTIANITSVTLLAANANRKYLLIQNNSGANIVISLTGIVLTGITDTASNTVLILLPGASYENPPNFCTASAITVWQASGGSINTVYVASA